MGASGRKSSISGEGAASQINANNKHGGGSDRVSGSKNNTSYQGKTRIVKILSMLQRNKRG